MSDNNWNNWQGLLQWGIIWHHHVISAESQNNLYQQLSGISSIWKRSLPRPARRGQDLLARHIRQRGHVDLQLQGRHVQSQHHPAVPEPLRRGEVRVLLQQRHADVRQLSGGHVLVRGSSDFERRLPLLRGRHLHCHHGNGRLHLMPRQLVVGWWDREVRGQHWLLQPGQQPEGVLPLQL